MVERFASPLLTLDDRALLHVDYTPGARPRRRRCAGKVASAYAKLGAVRLQASRRSSTVTAPFAQPTYAIATNKVYHYTSASTAIYNILTQGQMRLSPFFSVNDPREARRALSSIQSRTTGGADTAAEMRYIWALASEVYNTHMKVACFTRDFDMPGMPGPFGDEMRGWNHPATWAHYANRHTGVCLEFDRDQLILEFERQLNAEGETFHGDVEYHLNHFSRAIYDAVDQEQMQEFGLDAVLSYFIQTHFQPLFLQKHSDWAAEHEFRLLYKTASTLPVHFYVGQSLTGVYLGDSFSEALKPALWQALNNYSHARAYATGYFSDRLMAHEISKPSDASEAAPPSLKARRSGDLSQRVEVLRQAELKFAEERVHAKVVCEEAVSALRGSIHVMLTAPAGIKDLKCEVHEGHGTAIPSELRSAKPGVPGEVVPYETGFLGVIQGASEEARTSLVVSTALQYVWPARARVHGLITRAVRGAGSGSDQEIWRYQHEVSEESAVAAVLHLIRLFEENLTAAIARFAQELVASTQGPDSDLH